MAMDAPHSKEDGSKDIGVTTSMEGATEPDIARIERVYRFALRFEEWKRGTDTQVTGSLTDE